MGKLFMEDNLDWDALKKDSILCFVEIIYSPRAYMQTIGNYVD